MYEQLPTKQDRPPPKKIKFIKKRNTHAGIAYSACTILPLRYFFYTPCIVSKTLIDCASLSLQKETICRINVGDISLQSSIIIISLEKVIILITKHLCFVYFLACNLTSTCLVDRTTHKNVIKYAIDQDTFRTRKIFHRHL